ncbi:protein NRT1/ PTR FAMILY 5.10-like [Senna tora]|uniref:Protein NRT1/ PTR FAMILY 5.10-like n=1 Tax=Senna tora TaxID=362788 RepID=A0A835CAW8_9FABA|nr:protein NRT1/ PTR FAMILY 5.10-like [Senna tora]
MGIISTSNSQPDDVSEIERVLVDGETVSGAVDYKGRPAIRSASGYWRSASFIIGVEVTERLCYYGIQSNLINYLTERLHQSTATAAKNVNVWVGTASLLPLFGAFFADSYLGRYRTIILASFLYILGLGLLALSASGMLPSTHEFQTIIFFISLYLVALGQAGHKPCTQAFGADQFDENHPKESQERSSFFNWWYFTLCAFCSLTLWVLNYIQDNLSWVLGFGIPCLLMIFGLIIFLLGTKTYRFTINGDENEKKKKKNPFLRIARVFLAAIRNWKRSSPSDIAIKEKTCGTLPHQSSEQFKFLNKALFVTNDSKQNEANCNLIEVEEAKAVLRLLPIWATSLVYGLASAQVPTFFTKQGLTMDRNILLGFQIPPASLQFIIPCAIILFTPFYDFIFVPLARSITNKPFGITMLQRIGIGMFISIITLAIAALIEMRRLKEAKEALLMSVWWLIPQYFLFGIADVFTIVGLQEFFYDQVPNELRSMGVAMYLSVLGVGSLLSSFMIGVIEEVSGKDGGKSWFDDDINEAHIDYFYWLLSGLSLMAFVVYICFAKSYIYGKKGITLE